MELKPRVYIEADGIPKLKPGEWAWIVKNPEGREPVYLVFGCPCGTHSEKPWNCYIRIAAKGQDIPVPVWQWDGNWEEPTLTPSILRGDECKWHGFVVKGKFQLNP